MKKRDGIIISRVFLTSIKIQFFFAAYQVIADRSNSLHLGFDAPRKIPIFFLPLAITLAFSRHPV